MIIEDLFTVKKMADELKVKPNTITNKLLKLEIEPVIKVGVVGLYSSEAFEKIKIVKKRGRKPIDSDSDSYKKRKARYEAGKD
jgi:hypothetical protein